MCHKASALMPSASSMPVSEIWFDEQGGVESEGIAPVKVKFMASKCGKPRSYTNRSNDGRPGSKRQKAT